MLIMPENKIFYRLTQKLGRDWDAETRHLVNKRTASFCGIDCLDLNTCFLQDHRRNTSKHSSLGGRPNYRPLADAIDWAAIHSNNVRFDDWFQEAANDLSPSWQQTSYSDLLEGTESVDALRPAARSQPSVKSQRAGSMTTGRKVEGWPENVYGDGRDGHR